MKEMKVQASTVIENNSGAFLDKVDRKGFFKEATLRPKRLKRS